MMQDARGRNRIWSLGLGLILVLQFFVLLPLVLYLGNSDEFSTSLWTILPLYVKPAVFVLAAVVAITILLPKAWLERFVAMLGALALLVWVQGNFLVWDYGLLDGRAIDWSQQGWRGWLDAAVWIGVFSLVLFGPLKARRWVANLAAIGFLAMSVGALSMAGGQSDRLVGRELASGDEALGQIFRFSSNRNVLHIVMDGFQTDVFNEILDDGDLGLQLRDALSGFVYFPRHMGVFPYTHMSVPAILSGRVYGNEVPREAFLDAAVGRQGNTILNAASDAGFTVDLAVATGLEHLYARGASDHVYPVGSAMHATVQDLALQHAATLFDLSLFRVLPHVLKPFVYNDQKWFAQRLLVPGDYLNLRFFSHMAFLNAVREQMRADRPEPVYKLMHLMVSHTPFATTQSCQYVGRVLPIERDAVTAQARCGLLYVARVLERMKELGIYDDATVVLMADHGAWLPPSGVRSRADDVGREKVSPIAVAMAVPMFAIKPPGSTGVARASMAPSWIIDTAQTVANAAGIEGEFPGQDALALPETATRQRYFRIYEYQRSEWSAEYLTPIQEYEVTGDVLDRDAWVLRQTMVPPQ